MWRKELIRLVVSPTRPSLSPPTTNATPNIPSTILDYVDPLPFSEDMDTNQGACDEMAIEKEQHIPETQPPAHDPTAKKVMSESLLWDTLDALIVTKNAQTSPEHHGRPKKRKGQPKIDKPRNAKKKVVQKLFHGNKTTENLEESKEDE